MGKHAPGEKAAREEASLHRKVLAVERCEVRGAERSVGDLLVMGHPDGIGGCCGLPKQLRGGDFHGRQLFELPQR